tara:strand:+ start:115 stop:441 length:327 start_codon:yes stop_codon:yes gene_type:complete
MGLWPGHLLAASYIARWPKVSAALSCTHTHTHTHTQVLARLRFLIDKALQQASRDGVQPPLLAVALERLLRFGVSLGYLGLMLVFNVRDHVESEARLICHEPTGAPSG